MKTQAMIISVDPGKKTLGRFWEEGLPYNGTARQIIRAVSQTPSLGNPGSLLLGVGRKTSHSYAFMLLLIRNCLFDLLCVYISEFLQYITDSDILISSDFHSLLLIVTLQKLSCLLFAHIDLNHDV